MKSKHVNLVDLVDARDRNVKARLFPNLRALRRYTIWTEKYFPKEDAKAGGLLKYLLREMFTVQPRRPAATN